MHMTEGKRVIVIGCPGSGKSVFSRALQKKTGLPLYHLDLMYWNEDRTTVPKEEFRRRLSEVLQKPEWIIDGNYGSTMEMRFSACDTVVFLDYPTEICISGIRARMGKPRPDMPWVETGEDADFLAFVKSYNQDKRPQVLALMEKYPDKPVLWFHEREEAERFLAEL